MSKIKVLLADSGEIFREGLANALESKTEIEIVAKCATGLETIQKATECHPDIVILDECIWDFCVISSEHRFLDVAKRIKRQLPKTRIIITHDHQYPNISLCIQALADGYIDKDWPIDLFFVVIDGAFKGWVDLSPQIAAKILEDFTLSKKKTEQTSQEYDVALSGRETEILALISQKGISNKQIASTLFISESTVKTHLSNILQKMHAHSRQQAVSLAREKGLTFKKADIGHRAVSASIGIDHI